MSYTSPLMVELMVPRVKEVADRMHGFYEEIGWEHRDDSNTEYTTYVNPLISESNPPVIAYWQTTNNYKRSHFFPADVIDFKPGRLSKYSDGLRQPFLNELVEVCLVVPTDEDVHAIFERGGSLLESHAHISPRLHAGSQEFRFGDPFNYSLRVTANPGWEIISGKT